MDDLVRSLLADLSHSLDRLADELADDRPRLAHTLRREADRSPLAAPLGAAEPRRRWRREPLRPLLYRALEAGALDGAHFDRLMTVAARVRRPA